MAELPLAIRDTHILGVLRLESVIPPLGLVEVVDVLVVRVSELVDLEDDWNVFRVHMMSSLGKKEALMGFWGWSSGNPVVIGGGETHSRPLDGKGTVGLERGPHVREDLRHVVRVERQAAGEPLVDEPGANRPAEDVDGDQTLLLHVLTCGGSSRGLWRRVEEAHGEEQIIVAQLWCVEAKECG